jgi:hypothetical protein
MFFTGDALPGRERSALRGTLLRSGQAGPNAVPFSGRIGTRALRPGAYRVVLAATGGSSPAAILRFTIVKG